MDSPIGNAMVLRMVSERGRRVTPPMRGLHRKKQLFPLVQERHYTALITERLQGFIRALEPNAIAIAQRWGKTHDGIADDLGDLQNQAAKISEQFFGRDLAKEIAGVGQEIDLFQGEQFNRFAELAIGQRWDTSGSAVSVQAVQAWAQANQSLVKSLEGDAINRLNAIVSDGVQNGNSWQYIQKKIQALSDEMPREKAQLLAIDQIGKLNSALERSAHLDAGIQYYVWQITGDSKVRESHALMAGLVCDWNDATVYSDDGGKNWKKRTASMPKGHPGQDIRCRCTAAPFFDLLFAEAAEVAQKRINIPEYTAPVVQDPAELPKIPQSFQERLMASSERVKSVSGYRDLSNLPYPELPYRELAEKAHAPVIQRLAQTNPEMVAQATAAANEYVADAKRYNAPLRGDRKLTPEIVNEISALAELISQNRLTYDIALYRGISYGNWKIGDVVSNNGFSSFSSAEAHARTFLEGLETKYLLRLVAGDGAPIAPIATKTDTASVQFNVREKEFLGIPGMGLRVLATSQHPVDPKTVILDVEVVP